MVSYFTNYGVAQKYKTGSEIWRIPFGPPTHSIWFDGRWVSSSHTESPRWLAKVGRTEEALRNLAFLRRRQIDDDAVILEMAEINAAIREESAEKVSLRYYLPHHQGCQHSFLHYLCTVCAATMVWTGT